MTIPLTVIVILAVTLASGVWVGFALMATGIFSLEIFRNMPVDKFLANDIWGSLTSPELTALPLFIFMGELLFHTRLSESLFNGLAPWTNRLPGRLLHVNVMGCTLFAAVSGSSAATTATVGRITLSALLQRGYDKNLAMGSLAGAGTLGFLIPPSIIMIIYGVLAEVSILHLFIAGIIPGLLLAGLFMTYIGLRAGFNSGKTPPPEAAISWQQRWLALRELGPVLALILLVLGSMYSGIASPTEAAVVGVFGAVIVAALQRVLNWNSLRSALAGSIRTCSMIGLIISGALFLSKAMALLGMPQAVAAFINQLQLNPFALILLLTALYIVLGCVLDGLSVIVMTLPIALPLITGAGYDLVWFGVFLVIVVEMSQITPPVGFNLFVIQGLTDEPIGRITLAALPFFMIMLFFVVLITLFPELVLFLPAQLNG